MPRHRLLYLLIPPLLAGCPTGRDDDPTDDDDPASDPGCTDGTIDDAGICVPEHCGLGPWGPIETDETTVHVDASADPGGDGSPDHPLQTITGALDLVAGGAGPRIAVAAGTYVENLAIDQDHDGLELIGRCAEAIVVHGRGKR